MTNRVDSTLIVVATQVGHGAGAAVSAAGQPGEHLLGALEIKTAFAQSPFAFPWIIGDPHAEFMYIQ